MLRVCAACGTQNRVSPGHLADRGRCGRCHGNLPALAEPLEVNEAEFDAIITAAKVPVLVDFWAAWCGPCRMAAPHVQKVAANWQGRALVLKVDTEQNAGLAQRFRIRGIPNFAVFRDGRMVFQQAGLAPSSTMEGWLRDAA